MMNAILSKFWRTPPQPIALPPPPAVEENKELYYRNEKGWPCYNIEKLTPAECEVAYNECRTEASHERNRAILEAVAATALGVSTLAVGFVVANLASAFFVAIVAEIAAHMLTSCSPLTFFAVRVVTHMAALSGTATLLQMLWGATTESVQNHWEAAKHLDDQAINANLRKAVEKLSNVANRS